jgi:hypothetical protein
MRLSTLKRPKALWFRVKYPAGIPAKRLTPVRRRSDRMRAVMAAYRKEREIFLLEHPQCQLPGCNAKSRDVHHTRGRIGVLLMLKRFWKAVCRQHHDWIQLHPTEAREIGMLCNSGEWNCPPPTPDP